MILSIFKQFFIFAICFYLYSKLLNLKRISQTNILLALFLSFIFGILSSIFINYTPALSMPLQILLLLFGVLLIFHTTPKLAFVTTVITFGYCYALYNIAIFLSIAALYNFCNSQTVLFPFYVIILASILTCITAYIPFRFKRLKNGMRFLYQKDFTNWGVFIGFTILLCISIGRITDNPLNFTIALPLLLLFLLGFLLLFWWKNQITKSYIEKLRKAELESLRQELTEKNHEIEKLKENNDALAHIIHRDNKLIPSMEHAVCEFLDNKDALSVDELAQKGEALAKELKEMAASRTGILHDYQAHGQHIPITGVCSVDALLSYMQKKAFSAGITFQVGISADLTAFTASVVTPEDLSHLLSDLIENAIHAVKDCPDRNIQLHIHNISGNYAVEISDTGVPFPIEILQGFGIEQQTSHADDDGSGIGLMDIWNLKKKYRASMHIQEFNASSDTWCKKISVIFDSKNHYLIQTYRPEQILMTLKRSDLYVLQL